MKYLCSAESNSKQIHSTLTMNFFIVCFLFYYSLQFIQQYLLPDLSYISHVLEKRQTLAQLLITIGNFLKTLFFYFHLKVFAVYKIPRRTCKHNREGLYKPHKNAHPYFSRVHVSLFYSNGIVFSCKLSDFFVF